MKKFLINEEELTDIIKESINEVLCEINLFQGLKNGFKALKNTFKQAFNANNSRNGGYTNYSYNEKVPYENLSYNNYKQPYNNVNIKDRQQVNSRTNDVKSNPSTKQKEKGFIPDRKWAVNVFQNFNKKYFEGKIPLPSISVTNLKNNWGYLEYVASFNPITRGIISEPSKYNLYLTNAYYRAEKSVMQTLLHEMIHAYIYTVIKKYPVNQHGSEFTKIASNLNKDGWNISETTDIVETDVAVNENKKKHKNIK